MHVWYISKYAIPPSVGNPTRQYFLSKYLARIGGLNVTLVFSRSSNLTEFQKRNYRPTEFNQEGFRQIMLDGPKISLGFNLKRIWSWIEFELRLIKWIKSQRKKPEVIIVSSLSLLTFLTGVWVKKNYKARLIVEVRDIHPFTLIATGKFSEKNILIKVLKYIERLGYKHSDSIISPIPYFGDYLESISLEFSNKFEYIPMGFDHEFYQSKENSASRITLPSDKFIIGYFGSFGRTQATTIIFEAIRDLQKDTSIFFLLGGEGPEKTKGLDLIKGQSNYLDLGVIKKNEIPHLLSRCQLALNPWLKLDDLYEYGITPNKWIDYMYSEIPFIVCFNGKIEMLEQAKCASVIPPENLEILKKEIYRFRNMNPSHRKSMGLNGKDFLIKNLSYHVLSQKLNKLL